MSPDDETHQASGKRRESCWFHIESLLFTPLVLSVCFSFASKECSLECSLSLSLLRFSPVSWHIRLRSVSPSSCLFLRKCLSLHASLRMCLMSRMNLLLISLHLSRWEKKQYRSFPLKSFTSRKRRLALNAKRLEHKRQDCVRFSTESQ